ncbi:hypothetical protein [Streptomyces sp. 061-3]|uniref:hypothetical protein n=1 Tax=Streptomyces sp. 061-3 TaxID=2789268 RepID=UPI00398091B2
MSGTDDIRDVVREAVVIPPGPAGYAAARSELRGVGKGGVSRSPPLQKEAALQRVHSQPLRWSVWLPDSR